MKIYLLICLIVFTLSSNELFAQNYTIKWEKGINLPLKLSEIKATACNEKIYVIGGKITKDNSDLNDNEDVDFTYEFDPGKNTWSKKCNMPTKRYDVALATIDNLIYAISTKTEVYNTLTDKWQVLKPMDGGMAHLEAVTFNDKIYVFGSSEGEYNKTMMYDPKTNDWIEKTKIPTPRLAPSVALLNDKIYVLGGIGFNEKKQLGKFSQTIEVYDPVADSWVTETPMPDGLWGAEGVIVKDNNLILVNVRKINETPNNIYAYSPILKKWSVIEMNLPECYSEQGIAILGEKIFVIGGHDNSYIQYNDVYVGTLKKRPK